LAHKHCWLRFPPALRPIPTPCQSPSI